MQSPSNSPSVPVSTHFDQQQQYIHCTPISTPTLRSQPQSPSQNQLIHNMNPFLPDPVSPFSTKDRFLQNTPVPRVPITPPDSSGKSLVDIDIHSGPLGEPIDIPSTPSNQFIAQTEASPLIHNAAGSPVVSCTSPARGTISCNASPSRALPQNSPTEYVQTRLSNQPTDSIYASRSSDAGFVTPQSEASISSTDSVSPPNVYINGLPPNFPEEQLYNMTKDFGAIISVRTFTRHVSERPTGYGFVLFEALEAAEQCIETLRKYRNLHPSLAKQVHKIPGTAYANVQIPDDNSSSDQGAKDTFKSRMERFKDESSTNLYIEGLPLSIDGPTLAALMSPYKIMSSRLFHTRLSHPPRIIAFVRLETRTSAEEIIERLHGRMVRGWNDPGCRISVRFADTAEQRELRRQERMVQGEDHSPARLTMAQATLLNLQGAQSLPAKARPGSHLDNSFARGSTGSPLIHRPSLSHDQTMAYQEPSTAYGRIDDYDSRIASSRREDLPLKAHEPTLPSAVKARNGYTPAEELLLAAHAQQVQGRSVPNVFGRPSNHPNNFPAYSSHLSSSRISGMPGIDHVPHASLHSIAQEQYVEQQGYRYEDARDIRSSRDRDAVDKIPLGFENLSISRSQAPVQQQTSRSATLPSQIGNNRMRHNIPNSRIITGYDTYDIGSKHNSHNIPSSIKNTAKSNINVNTKRAVGRNSQNIIDGESMGVAADDSHYNDKEENADSPLVSPALTYTSHGRTPQTLSPVTPFFGSFAHGESFDGPPMSGPPMKGKDKAITTAEDC